MSIFQKPDIAKHLGNLEINVGESTIVENSVK